VARVVGVVTEAEELPVAPRVASGVVDLFVYVVVLNLFVEYLPTVLSETFTLSVLTALLLKGVLEVVVAAKKRVRTWFTAAEGPVGKALAALGLWAVLFGSKFVVLEVVHLVFGEAVQLGGFFSVTLLVVALMLARTGVRRLLVLTGPPGSPDRTCGGKGSTST
jgi:hypothetical protein